MDFLKNFFAHLTGLDESGRHKLTNLTAVVLLVVSAVLTINILQLQQEIRQRAGACQNLNADCNNNGKSCCSGLSCNLDPSKKNGQGKCVAASQPPSEGGGGQGQGNGGDTTPPTTTTDSGPGIPGPRPEGENSTTNPPGVAVCTLSFYGPTQLIGTRLSPTSARFNWWPTPGGADKQFIQYGLESGKPIWGLMNIPGNQGEVVINDLPANQLVWAQVRAYRGNCYEDTGWASVNPGTKQANAAVPQTITSPTIITYPTSVVPTETPLPTLPVDSSFNTAPSPLPDEDGLFLGLSEFGFNWKILLFLVLLFFFFFPFWKKRKKKKEEDN